MKTKAENETRNAYVTRDTILKLLSDEEIARVSTAETASGLADGEEYLDLERLSEGVHKAIVPLPSMGRVLPRKAVGDQTWTKILAELAVSVARDKTLSA